MRAAQIENGIVVNVIEVESLDVFDGLVEAQNADIGDAWDGAQFIQRVEPSATAAEANAPILAALDTIDLKSIRALRDGDQGFIEKYRAESAALRKQLVQVTKT
jgi:hypothetical protein